MATSPPLLDEAARRAFAETLDENFCVSAGAGVGKTTAITRRIANLALRRHEQPDLLRRLVVVTYGKLAAEELRVRTRDLILEQLDASAYGRQTLLAELRGAFFGTIHSFCLKLIGDEGRFLGLPDNAALLENRDEPALWERFCQCDALSDLQLPPAVLDAVSRHLTFDQLLALAREFPAGTAGPPFDPAESPPGIDLSSALGFVAKRGTEKTREHQDRLRRWQREFESGAPFLKLPEFKGGASGFLTELRAATLPYVRWLNAAAGSLAASIASAYQSFRLEEGVMTFADQIHWARRLIEDPAILRRLRERGFIVILDEAQDTDAEMFAILTEITRPVGSPVGAWPGDLAAAGPLPGRFSFVGDDQQAIYGQRADLRVYRAYVDAFRGGSGGSRLEFSVTMRCPRRVIDVVNAVFAGGRLPQTDAEFRALDPRPDCPLGDAWRMELSAVPEDSSRLNKDDRLYREIVRVADFARQRGLAGLGLSRWSELAIIAPRVSWLEQAARVFGSHKLPTVLLSQRAIARDQPRQSWPAALLHVVLHPWDRFELIGVLRELFAVSDVDLARLHRAGGLTFWPTLPATSAAPRLVRGLKLLHELRAALPGGSTAPAADDRATLSRYVEYVLEKTALAARLEAIGEPPDSLRAFRALAFKAECDGLTLRQWVRSLVNSLEDPAPPPAGSANAIQLLTSQKAKGLEWPAVIALGAGCAISERRRSYPCVEVRDRITRVHFSGSTLDDDEGEAARQAREEELQRMLYVTFTRARRLLIVPDGARLYDGKGPNFQQLARWMELDLPPIFADADTAAPPPPAAVPEAAATPPFVENKRRLARASEISRNIPKRVLPSGLVHGAKPSEPGDRAPAADFETGAGGVDYGNWWHAAMERYPWNAPENERNDYVDVEISRVPAAARWASRAIDELTRFAQSEPHAAFLEHGRVFLPEAPFSHPASTEEWVEGIMDLVIVTQPSNELWVVDWKTDRRRASDESDDEFLRRLAEKYAPQLRAYAAVFARGFNRPVSRLFLYSTPLAQAVSVDGSVLMPYAT